MTIEEGSGYGDDEDNDPWRETGDDDSHGPWVPWSQRPENDTPKHKSTSDDDKKNVGVSDHDVGINEIDDRHVTKKTSSGGSSLVVRLRNRWEVAKAVARVLLPTLVCYLATGLSETKLL